MDLIDVLAEAERDEREMEKGVSEIAALLGEREEDLANQRRLVESLKTALSRYGSEEAKAALAHQEELRGQEIDWQSFSRADAVFRAVLDAATDDDDDVEVGVSPGDIAHYLAAHGRSGDTPNLVSAALTYLSRQNKVFSAGRGRWIPMTEALLRVKASFVSEEDAVED